MPKEPIKISELTPATSLAGFYTLGYKIVDGGKKSIRLDLSYVQTAYDNTVDAISKANQATAAANKAAADANTTMAQISQEASQKMTDLRQLEATVSEQEEARVNFYTQVQAKEQARQNDEIKRQEAAKSAAKAEADRVTKDTERNRIFAKKVEEANDAIQGAGIAEEKATKAADNATEATGKANVAADRLNNLSDHRDEIREGYWWRWNETTKEWYNTGEIAKGNVMFATFGLEPSSGVLTMYTDEEYTGANFEITENGKLQVII